MCVLCIICVCVYVHTYTSEKSRDEENNLLHTTMNLINIAATMKNKYRMCLSKTALLVQQNKFHQSQHLHKKINT